MNTTHHMFHVACPNKPRVYSMTIACLLVCLVMPSASATEYYVAKNHPNASDSNDGMAIDRPFKTLARAVQEIWPGDTLTISGGIYREPLLPQRSGTSTQSITFRAYPGDDGNVVIRGSDVVNNWTNQGGNVWSIERQPLSLVDYPPFWPIDGEYTRRREMVFVDGVPLQQVLTAPEMGDGKFRIDDIAGKYFLYSSVNLNNALVEIADRDRGIWAPWASYITWVGLRVEHIANDPVIAAMNVGANQTVINCQINDNNQVGIMVGDDSKILFSTANRNGRVGIILPSSNCLLDSNETSFNSWRYSLDWDAGGVKIITNWPANNRITRHTARFNNGRGIWLDHTGSGNVVESSFFEGNKIAGLQFEVTRGPNWAINNVVVGTLRANLDPYPESDGVGIGMRESRNTILYNNTIVDVTGAGILISGDERDGGDGQLDYMADTQVTNNIVVGSGSAAVRVWVWGNGRLEFRVGTHHFDNNLYYGNDTTIIFPRMESWGDENWSLDEFQLNRNEDLNSLETDPRFTDREGQDFSLFGESPAIDAGQNIAEVSVDKINVHRPQGPLSDIGAFEFCQQEPCAPFFWDGFESGSTHKWSTSG